MSDRHSGDNKRASDFNDKRDKKYDYGDEDEVKDTRSSRNSLSNRSRSPPVSRTKSPSRWDDPLKQFSEKHKPEKVPKHRAPPNRFNIPPGRQWDGIDRSNGFEVAYFKKLAQQERKKDLDYKYTVADM